jgi:hypothetical protein
MKTLLFAAVVAAAQLRNPVLFVTQVPVPADFTTVVSTFGNQLPTAADAPRGGDLWIRYPDGTTKNLTRAAGFGGSGMQGASAIAVREPSVHWSGTKALFSMVVGAPPRQYLWEDYYWQIYEITGLGQNDPPVIRKIANQPAGYNNVSPIYGTDDRILFTSDRPRGGERHLYPQLDEYEEAATVTGLWSLDPISGDLRLLNHTPSGLFSPSIDSFGRVIFTRWDHLQRDQQADADAVDGGAYGTFDYADESEAAARSSQRVEVFPEPRSSRTDLLAGTNLQGISINQFFPWEINEDGTSEETINHIGRHELFSYFDRSMSDSGLSEFYGTNRNNVENLFQLREDPAHPGVYFGVDAPEFETHAAGQIVRFGAEPSLAADKIAITYITPRSTRGPEGVGAPDASGHYRDPLPLSDGTLLAVHSAEMRGDANDGDVAHMQLFQADQVRGLGGTASPKAGRRVLARVMHDAAAKNAATSGPAGSVQVASDGSLAALIPARRAMSWQLTDGAGTPVVRERYWLTFQPGEVRVCSACHGVNSRDQLGAAPPQNSPEALRALLKTWKATQTQTTRRRATK